MDRGEGFFSCFGRELSFELFLGGKEFVAFELAMAMKSKDYLGLAVG